MYGTRAAWKKSKYSLSHNSFREVGGMGREVKGSLIIPQVVLPQNLYGIEPNRIVAHMVLKTAANGMHIRWNESDCEESEETADLIDNIPLNPDVYVSSDDTEWILHNTNVHRIFTTRDVLRQSSDQQAS
ncbi:hypothetical protein TNCV_3514561 [Trichonephila clavipes]|nr:hypothetical protein TNCV_3514561 [Trichonephila clavipes]